MSKLTLDELKERDLALRVARDPSAGPIELTEQAWAYLQRFTEREVGNLRSLISDAESRPQRIDQLRSELDDALYRSGESDTHPLLHPKPPAERLVELIHIESEPTEEFLLLTKKVRLLYDLFVASLVDYAEDNGIHDEVMADAVQFSLGEDIAVSYSDNLTERES